MIFKRVTFFFVLLTIVSLPFLVHKAIWLARSKKAIGTMGFAGKSQAGQPVHNYALIFFIAGKDSIWFNGKDNILFKQGNQVPVRYQADNPKDARIDIFTSIWGDTLVYGGIPVLILIVIFLDPKIIPIRSKVKLNKKKPFVEFIH
jgi:hypothetical protein